MLATCTRSLAPQALLGTYWKANTDAEAAAAPFAKSRRDCLVIQPPYSSRNGGKTLSSQSFCERASARKRNTCPGFLCPGESSTPLATSTPAGFTLATASATFDGFRPPDKITDSSGCSRTIDAASLQSNVFPLPPNSPGHQASSRIQGVPKSPMAARDCRSFTPKAFHHRDPSIDEFLRIGNRFRAMKLGGVNAAAANNLLYQGNVRVYKDPDTTHPIRKIREPIATGLEGQIPFRTRVEIDPNRVNTRLTSTERFLSDGKSANLDCRRTALPSSELSKKLAAGPVRRHFRPPLPRLRFRFSVPSTIFRRLSISKGQLRMPLTRASDRISDFTAPSPSVR